VGGLALTVALAATLTSGSGVAPTDPSAALTEQEAAPPRLSRVALTAVPDVVSPRVVRPSRIAAQRTLRAAQQAEFAHFTLASPRSRDMRGIEPSLYRGRFFHPSTEVIRRCVIQRESLGYYDVVSPSGSYFGAYQVSRPLARGVTWMMLPEHRALLGRDAAKRLMAQLRDRPMNTWPRYWQDAAFFTVMNWEGRHSGRQHWAGGRTHC
jgi:hypothetical protein